MRAKATDAGALGDTISITNLQSKKTLQAVIVGPGRVTVNTAPTGRLAVAQP
jgi:flagella basal body P-ring formation protein FlgA